MTNDIIIDKGRDLPKRPKQKFRDSSLDYKFTQPGGGVLRTGDPRELQKLQRAMRQSFVNCGKAVVGGGFNPRNQGEMNWVYGKKSKSEE